MRFAKSRLIGFCLFSLWLFLVRLSESQHKSIIFLYLKILHDWKIDNKLHQTHLLHNLVCREYVRYYGDEDATWKSIKIALKVHHEWHRHSPDCVFRKLNSSQCECSLANCNKKKKTFISAEFCNICVLESPWFHFVHANRCQDQPNNCLRKY